MAAELKYKISATDDSKKVFDASKKSADGYGKSLKGIATVAKSLSTSTKSLAKEMKELSKSFREAVDGMNKMGGGRDGSERRGRSTSDGTGTSHRSITGGISTGMGIAGSAGSEDVAIAQKVHLWGMKKAEESVRRHAVPKQASSMFGTSPAGGAAQAEGGATGGAMGKAGKVLGPAAIAAAIVGGAYMVAESQSHPFLSRGEAQLKNIQSLGINSGRKDIAGLYQGRGNLTGQEITEMSLGYQRQTGGLKSGGDVDKLRASLADIVSAFGMEAGDVGNRAGVLGRFGGAGGGVDALYQAVGTAQKVGFGGARTQEFLDDLSEVMTKAVYDGSSASAEDLTSMLSGVIGTGDARLAARASGLVSQQVSAANQAAALTGGDATSAGLQAVSMKLRREGRGGNLIEAMAASENAKYFSQAQAEAAQFRYGGGKNKNLAALEYTKRMGMDIPSATQRMKMYELGLAGGGGQVAAAGTGKLATGVQFAKTSEATNLIKGTGIIQEMNELSIAGKEAASTLRTVKYGLAQIKNLGAGGSVPSGGTATYQSHTGGK